METSRPAWIRRDRLERIATAERDRRAGRTAVAIAALGEAVEWPARAVLALALLPDDEGAHARRILEEGLDQWALDTGQGPLDAASFALELDRPIESGELERAFAEAEAQVDEMHDANRVAERVLLDAPFGFAEAAEIDPLDEELDPLERSAHAAMVAQRSQAMDAASVPEPQTAAPGSAESPADRRGDGSRAVVLATLERWLQNLERGRVGRVQ